MNFYIFNSKNIFKKATFYIVMVFIGYNIVLDIALQWYVDKKTNKYSFIDEKVSKSKHMKLQDNANNLDIIFIGSSRTMYHVSTEEFQKMGIEIYNLGVSDRGLVDYPYMIKEAISLEPKMIVISIEIPALYKGAIGNYKQLTGVDLKYIFRFENIAEWSKSLKQYILSKHLLFQHAEPMHIRLSQFFHKFDAKSVVDFKSPLKKHKLNRSNVESKNNERLKADCKIFDYNYPSSKKVVVKCTNGDGILFGHTVGDVNRTIAFQKPDSKYISWLNALLGTIKENGIEPILILEPVFRQKYSYNLSQIEEQINAKIIDLTKMQIDNKYWADNKHVNVHGRKIYTDKLIKSLYEKN